MTVSRRAAMTAIPAAFATPQINAAPALTAQEHDARIAHQIELLRLLAEARYPQVTRWHIRVGTNAGLPLTIVASD